MSAINKIVEFLETDAGCQSEITHPYKLWKHIITEARRLALEEAKDKPTANSDIVAYVKLWLNTGLIYEMENVDKGNLLSHISKYTPMPAPKEVKEPMNYGERLEKGAELLEKEAKSTDLWGQHKAMIKLAQDKGLILAANWAVNMSGKTFSEVKEQGEAGLADPDYIKWKIAQCTPAPVASGLREDSLESWENEAEAFYKVTGYLRPGKDPGIIGDEGYTARRDKAWKIWSAGWCYRDDNPPTPQAEKVDRTEIEFPCPTCGAERFKTERRMNGDSWCRYGHKHPTKDFVRHAAKVEEPLAVLADRKGKSILTVGPYYTGKWVVTISNDGMNGECIAAEATLSECEAKCRQYLNTLKDKGEKI